MITVQDIAKAVLQTLLAPAAMAARIVGLRFARVELWLALVLVAVLGALATVLVEGMVILVPLGEVPVPVGPLTYCVILASTLVIVVFGIYYTGQALGGSGTFPATLMLVVWLEVMAIVVRLVLAIGGVFGAGLMGILSVMGLVVLMWSLVNFVGVLHGFGLFKAILTLVLAVIGISFGLAFLLILIGIGAEGGR